VTEFLEGDGFAVESLVVSFNFPTAAWMIGTAEDEFDTVILCFSVECFLDKLLPIIVVNFTRNSSCTECSRESVDRRGCIFVEVDITFHSLTATIIGESGDIDLTNATDSELEGIALPHSVNMLMLKPFAGRLWFSFDSDEKSMFLEDTMNRSPGTGKVELVVDSPGSPCRIFPFESNDPLFQRCWNRSS